MESPISEAADAPSASARADDLDAGTGSAPGEDDADARLETETGTGPPGASRWQRLRRTPLFEWGVLIGAALVVAFLIRSFLVTSFWIPSESMYPTLKTDDRVLVNRLSYRLHDVNRGDIVVFDAPPGQESGGIKDFVKRVIGLPGETIEGRDGRIYIDGEPIEEPWLPEGTQSRTFGPEVVPPGSVWVLGDNRLVSADSTVFGPIDESVIVGRVFARIWPLNRIDLL